MDAKTFLDAHIPQLLLEGKGEPDCWIVFKTRGGIVTDKPLSIFKTREALYAKLQKIGDDTPAYFGIAIASWWFDDND